MLILCCFKVAVWVVREIWMVYLHGDHAVQTCENQEPGISKKTSVFWATQEKKVKGYVGIYIVSIIRYHKRFPL